MSTGFVISVALLFGAMGGAAIATPVRFLRSVGSEPLGRDGRNEVRAVYGGFGLMMCALLFFALRESVYSPGILLCIGLALIGMAAGRAISAALDRSISPQMVAIMAGEIGFGGLLLMAL